MPWTKPYFYVCNLHCIVSFLIISSYIIPYVSKASRAFIPSCIFFKTIRSPRAFSKARVNTSSSISRGTTHTPSMSPTRISPSFDPYALHFDRHTVVDHLSTRRLILCIGTVGEAREVERQNPLRVTGISVDNRSGRLALDRTGTHQLAPQGITQGKNRNKQ